MSSWLDKFVPSIVRSESKRATAGSVPEGLWSKCVKCDAVLYRAEVIRNYDVCPKCHYHMRIDARTRLRSFLDDMPEHDIGSEAVPVDRLKFRDSKRYKDRITAAQKKTGETEAMLVAEGEIGRTPIVAACQDFTFMGGSMGAGVGEAPQDRFGDY